MSKRPASASSHADGKKSRLENLDKITTQIRFEENLITEFAYQGFDVLKIRALMLDKEPDNVVFNKELSLLLHIYILRGTNLTKIANRSSETAKERLIALREKYNIWNRNTSTDCMNNDTVTMSRIAASFAPVLARIMNEMGNKAHRYLDSDTRQKCFLTLPSFMESPTAACLIPRKGLAPGEVDKMLQRHLQWSMAFDEVINSGPGRTSTSRDLIEKYQAATHGSPLLSDSQRIALLLELGSLIPSGKTYKCIWSDYAIGEIPWDEYGSDDDDDRKMEESL